MPKQYVYESKAPGRLGIQKTIKTFDRATGETLRSPSVHVDFERHQTERDAKGHFRVYGICSIGDQFAEDTGMTIDQAHALIMSPKMQRVFGEIKCIIGPKTAVPEVATKEPEPTFAEPKEPKASKK